MQFPAELSHLEWPVLAALALAAVIIGFSKTSFASIAAVSVAIFALVMPAKESTAAVLLLLITGDIVGVAIFGRHASWRLLIRLVPTVIVGLGIGAVFMKLVDDHVMRLTIGTVLLVSVLIQLWLRRKPADAPSPASINWFAAGATGVAAGFTTMTANAAGPVMALYLLAARIDKIRFIGTTAWFFGIINVSKLPLTASLGLFTPQVMWMFVAGVPFVLLGTALGRLVVHRVTQRQFELVTMLAAAGGALTLLLF